MDFTIRKAKKEDMPQVLGLIKALAIFEKEPDAVEVTVEDLENDGFGENPAFHCFVAEINYKIEELENIIKMLSIRKKILQLKEKYGVIIL